MDFFEIRNINCIPQYDKEILLKKLRIRGYRITKQRELIIDLILENPEKKCADIYDMAREQDTSIGVSTVYRLRRLMEEIGVF